MRARRGLTAFAVLGATLTTGISPVEGAFNGGGGGGARPPAEQPEADCTIVGTNGTDVLIGTVGDDIICGLGGADLIFGLGGDDVLRGGGGPDLLVGSRGSDLLDGGPGFDIGIGGRGTDTCTNLASRFGCELEPDDMGPTVTLLSPQQGAVIDTGERGTATGGFFVEVSAVDDNGVAAVVVDGPGTPGDAVLEDTAWRIEVVGAPSGVHAYTVTATDALGNETTLDLDVEIIEPAPDDTLVHPEVEVVDGALQTALGSYDQTAGTMTFAGDVTDTIEVGTVLLAGVIPDIAPLGFNRLVTAVEIVGDATQVTTRQATLTEAFRDLNIQLGGDILSDNPGNPVEVVQPQGITFGGGDVFEVGFSGEATVSPPNNDFTAEIEASGIAGAGAAIIIDNTTVTDFVVGGYVDVDADWFVGFQGDLFTPIEADDGLVEVDLGTFTAFVPFPLIVTIELEIEAQVTVEATAQGGIGGDFSLFSSGKALYDHDAADPWTVTDRFEPVGEATSVNLSGEIEVEAALLADFEVKLYDGVGPSLEVGPAIRAEAEIDAFEQTLSVEAGLGIVGRIGAEGEIPVIDFEFFDFSVRLFSYPLFTFYERVFSLGSDPEITTATLPRATGGEPYSTQLEADVDGPVADWSLVDGSLPGSLSLSDDGRISGTPGVVGSFPIRVRVEDERGRSDERNLTLTVERPVFEITTSNLVTGTVGESYFDRVEAPMWDPGSPTFEQIGGSLPDGLSLLSTGLVFGTPTESGFFVVSVRATNPVTSETDVQVIELRIDPAPVNDPGAWNVARRSETTSDWSLPVQPLDYFNIDLYVDIATYDGERPDTGWYMGSHVELAGGAIELEIGLQEAGDERMAVFSTRYANAADFAAASLEAASGTDTVISVANQTITMSRPFQWQAGTEYIFRIWEFDSNGPDDTRRWGGWIREADTGDEVLIGSQLVPNAAGRFNGEVQSFARLLDYGSTSCSDPQTTIRVRVEGRSADAIGPVAAPQPGFADLGEASPECSIQAVVNLFLSGPFAGTVVHEFGLFNL